MSRNIRIKNIINEILVSYSRDIYKDCNSVTSHSLNEMYITVICKLKFIEYLEFLYHNPKYINNMAKATLKHNDQIRFELFEEIGALKRIIRFRNGNYSEKIKQKHYTEQKSCYSVRLFKLLSKWEQRFSVNYFAISIEVGIDIQYNYDTNYKLSGIYENDVNLFIDNQQIETEYQLFFGIDGFDDDYVFDNEFLIKKIICERILIYYYVKNATKIEGVEVSELLKKHIK